MSPHNCSYVVSELMESDLHHIIVSPQQLSEDHIKIFMYQILRGVCVCLCVCVCVCVCVCLCVCVVLCVCVSSTCNDGLCSVLCGCILVAVCGQCTTYFLGCTPTTAVLQPIEVTYMSSPLKGKLIYPSTKLDLISSPTSLAHPYIVQE